MKVTIDIDCTPEEARRCLGLPDVSPLHEAFMKEMQKRFDEQLSSMDMEQLMRQWLPGGFEGWEQMRKNVWSAFEAAMQGPKPGGRGGSGGSDDERR